MENFKRDYKFSSLNSCPTINQDITNLCNKLDSIHISSEEDSTIKYELNLACLSLPPTTTQTSNKIIKFPIPGLVESTRNNEILVQVKIEEITHTCLLDTGAEICVFGNESEEIWKSFTNVPIHKELIIRTAGDERHPGVVKKIPIEYDNEIKQIQFVFAPSIAIPIALGMNFCKAWNIELVRMKIKNSLKDDSNNNDVEINLNTIEKEEEEWKLTDTQKHKFEEYLKYFNFSDGDTLGCQNLMEHKIDTGTNPPVFCLPYRYNPRVGDKIKEIIDHWLYLRVIETSTSEWRLPIVAVTKADGNLRLCLDARKLNAITKKDCHITPDVLHKIESLPHKAKYYVRLDLNEAFLQTKLNINDRKKTAFSIPGIGDYQFIRMPFGLVNAAATQSRLMDAIFTKCKSQFVMHYLDDVIIMGRTFEELLKNIKIVAQLLSSHGLTISRKKTSNVLKRIRILGHIISENGVHTDPRKIEAIANWQQPKTKKELLRFLGFANWYRRFIKDYATVTAPLYEITKTAKWTDNIWNQCRVKAFADVKELMTKSPVLRNPNWSLPMTIQADASNFGIGAVLTQSDDEGEYVIEYFSAKLSKAEIKYSPTEKELLAVIKALKHFRYYIEFNEITILSDHHALQYLLNMQVLSGRLARWILEIQPYANRIKHRAGKDMVVADALSRANNAMELTDEPQWYMEFHNELLMNPGNYPQYCINDGRIFRKIPWQRNEQDDDYREFPPPSEIKKIIKNVHEKLIHAGAKPVYHKIKATYWWPDMMSDIKTFIRTCITCAAIKPPNYKLTPPIGQFRVPRDIMTALSIDIKGPLPASGRHKYRYIITVVDLLSRYGWGKRLAKVTSKDINKFLLEIFEEQKSCPKYMYHDNGKVFDSNEFHEFLIRNKIKSLPTAIYHPQANPVERLNRSITEGVRIMLAKDPTKQYRWATVLNEILLNINTKYNDVTGITPFEIQYGMSYEEKMQHKPYNDNYHNQLKSIAYMRSKLRFLQNKKQFNRRALHRSFNINEIVMIKTHFLSNAEKNVAGKLFPLFEIGIIRTQIEPYAYEVEKTDGKIIKLNIKDIKNIDIHLQEKLRHYFK